MVPRAVDLLKKSSVEICIETGAGLEAGFPDDDYTARGAHAVSADEVRRQSEVLLCVRVPELPDGLTAGSTVIGFCDPLTDPGWLRAMPRPA